jgi:hypothetical protein
LKERSPCCRAAFSFALKIINEVECAMHLRHESAQRVVLTSIHFSKSTYRAKRMSSKNLTATILIGFLFALKANALSVLSGSVTISSRPIPSPYPPHLVSDFGSFSLVLLLMAYYYIVWLAVGREPKLGIVNVCYDPPKGMSPAEARFALIGGTDRKTTAAVLAHMASEKIVRIVPIGEEYDITRLVDAAPEDIPTEEQRAFEVLFPRDAANPQGPTRRVNPKDATLMIQFSSQIYEALDKRLRGKYFRRNLGWSVLGFLFSVLYALALLNRYSSSGTAFLVFWFFLFTGGFGVMVATNLVPLFKDWMRGELSAWNAARSFLGLPVFMAPVLFVIYLIAAKTSWAYGEMIGIALTMNIVWGVLLKSTSAEGMEVKRQLAGFKEYLVSVERDRLDKLNDPSRSPVLTDEFFAYAIALDVKEGWGDRLENSLFGVATWR